LETQFRDRAPNLGGATSCGVRTSSAKLLVSTLRSIRHSCRGGSGIESEADAEGGSVDVPLASESAPRRPWGRITAVVVVALVAITAISIAVRQPNRAPSITDVSVSSETATTAPPTTLTFTGQATDPDGDVLSYTWDFGDGGTASGTQVTHAYGVPGWYLALLTVSDGKNGVTTSDDQLLFVHALSAPADGRMPPSPPTGCAIRCVGSTGLAVLAANRSTAPADSDVRFSGNGSWAYVWSWNNASNTSRGGTYTAVSAAEDASLFSLVYSWGDGTANTTGTALQVGQATHRFVSPGNYFVRLTVTSDLWNRSSGYTVRVLASAPPVQLKYPDIFGSAIAGEPDSLDPVVDNESAGGEVLQNLYETLVSVPADSESVAPLVPRLAIEVPSTTNNGTSADGRNYTFTLRQNVTFHDRSQLAVRDVAFSFRRMLAIHPPDGPSRILERLLTNSISAFAGADCNPSIAGTQNCTIGDWVNATFPVRATVPAYMSAALPSEPSWDTTALNISTAWAVSNSTVLPTGNNSVVFHLLRPYPAFLPILASTVGSILSESCLRSNGGVRWGAPNSNLARGADCGSGPFTLTAWSANQAIVLTRFDQYWRGPAKVPTVHILPVRDVMSREFLLLAGDVDSAAIDRDHQWDVMNADGTPKSPTLRIAKDRPEFAVSFFGYNQNVTIAVAAALGPISVPPAFFADVHVRRAFTYAFDYGAFVVNVTHDAGLQPRGPIPLGLPGYNASIPLFPFDLARAATELNATPYWLSGFNLTLYYRAGNDYEEHGCRLLANGLEALHSQKGSPGAISVGVRSLTPAAYIGALRAGGLPLALFSWAPRFADPLDSVAPFLRRGSAFPTWIGYGNATLDALIDAAASELNETTRIQDFLDLTARAVLDDVPYLWVFQGTSFHVERAWVSGYYFNPMLQGLDYYPLSKG